MEKNNPAVFECPKGKGGLHTWERNPDMSATCRSCKLHLTVLQAADCFEDPKAMTPDLEKLAVNAVEAQAAYSRDPSPENSKRFITARYEYREALPPAAEWLTLTARNRELEQALRPFAAISDDTGCNDGLRLLNAREDALACGINLRVADIRAARALTPQGENHDGR